MPETLTQQVTEKLFDYYNDHYADNGYVSELVTSICDHDGYVHERITRKLFNDHGSCVKEYIDAGNPANNVLTILEWLGY